jgi:surfactin synthase thioesterase subunit
MQLPGRERLIDEEPYRDLNKAADDFADLIKEKYSGNSVAFFGHCFLGSVLAFEVVKRLKSCKEIDVKYLFVSAGFTPGSNRDYGLNFDDDDKFITGVEKLTGFKNEAFAIPELRELLLPGLKADFEMDVKYKARENDTIDIPIGAIYAENDNFVDKSEVELWRKCTTKDFKLFKASGKHLYIYDNPQEAIDIIRNTINNIN